MHKTFGKLLTDAMDVSDITQKELAGKLGVSSSTVSYYCKDKRIPPYPVMVKICKILQFNLNEIYQIPSNQISNDELMLLRKYEALENDDKEFFDKLIDVMLSNEKYSRR